jgi:predicted Zn-dependent protease
MSIDWIDAESAIDKSQALRARRVELEVMLQEDPSDLSAALQLLAVLDQLEVGAQEIVAACQPIFEQHPNDPSLAAWLAQFSYRMGEFKMSMLTAKHALAHDALEPLANFTVGQLLLMAGKFEDACKYAGRAWEQGQAKHYRADIGRLYCIALARQRKFDEAYEFQRERLAEDPRRTQAVIDTADLLTEMGRRKEATILLEKSHADKPRDTDLLFRLAVGAFEFDELRDARRWADKLLKVDPQHLEGWHLRAQVRLKQDDPQGALADHEMIRELSKSIPLDQSFRAQCLTALDRHNEAIAALEQGLKEAAAYPEQQRRYEDHLKQLRG